MKEPNYPFRTSVEDTPDVEEHLIQLYKLASVGRLIAGVAHEINNPTTFIRGNIKIVRESLSDIIPILDKIYNENPQLKIARLDYKVFKENILILLDDMMEGADRIHRIVDGLRDFVRKDERTLSDDVNINHLIRTRLRVTEKEVRKIARLKIILDDTIPIFKGSIQRLEQVLMNLLMNASQAVEHEKGLVTLETSFSPKTAEILIRISDNGHGIDENNLTHIFEPFFTTRRSKGGTGLGLSICYGIIKDHGGRIDVQSKVGEGTAFTIHIPVNPSQTESRR